MTREDKVKAFIEASKHKNNAEGGDLQLWMDVFTEELTEYLDAVVQYDDNPCDDTREAMIKEWADVQYTLSNHAWFFDFDGEEAFNRVSESNMSKVIKGQVLYREDGKILKGPNYQPPNMQGI